MSQVPFVKFPPGQGTGIVIISVLAALSTLAVSFFLVRVLWVAISPMVTRSAVRTQSKESVFFHTQLGVYSACLLLGNFFSSVAEMVSFFWASEGGITEGGLCTTQSVFLEIGDFLTAYFVVAIACHTFISLVLGRRQTLWMISLVVVGGWTCGIVLGVAPVQVLVPDLGPFYGNTGLFCFITEGYPVARFYMHTLLIIITAALSSILFSIIFLVLRGTLVIGRRISFTLDPQRRWDGRVGTSEEYQRFIAAIARSMLWYPVGYILFLAPITICGLMDISHYPVSIGARYFSAACYSLLGLGNVCILYNVIYVLGPAFNNLNTSNRSLDVENARSREKNVPAMNEKGNQSTPSKRLSGHGVVPYRVPEDSTPTTWDYRQTPSVKRPAASALLAHQRSFSTTSDSSSRRLLTDTNGRNVGFHSRAPSDASVFSSESGATIGRSITPISQLVDRNIITSPEAARRKNNPIVAASPSQLQVAIGHQFTASADSLGLLPAPRPSRSPVNRRPSIEHMSPISSSVESGSPSDRPESLISMYMSRTPVDKFQFSNAHPLPPLPPMAANNGSSKLLPSLSAVAGVPQDRKALSPVASSPSEYSNSPPSPMLGSSSDSESADSFQDEVQHRMNGGTAGPSSLTFATLVTNAAIDNRPAPTAQMRQVQSEVHASQRSVTTVKQASTSDGAPIPGVLHPRTPASAHYARRSEDDPAGYREPPRRLFEQTHMRTGSSSQTYF